MPDALYREVLAATDQGRTLDAYRLGLQAGPLETWSGLEAGVLAARLARHLGGSTLSWRLIQRTCRAHPRSARARLQHLYGVLEQRGYFSAWHYLARLEQCPTDVPLDRAEILAARGDINLVFRDFEAAGAAFAEAQGLAPESPWIWTESSNFWRVQNQPQECLHYLDHALTLRPFFRPAVQLRAQVLQSLGRDGEALAFLEEARGHLQFSGIMAQLVSIHSEREDWRALLEAVEEMRVRMPLAEEGMASWFAAQEADALIGLGDFSAAADQAERAGEKNKWYKKLAGRLREVTAPGRRVKIDVPHILQDYNTCAPATLTAVTTFWQRPIAQETLIDEICYDGTTAVAERRWVEANGWFCREFKVDWQIATALLDLGLPFVLSTQEIDSGHAQCLIGYDTVRGTLLIRDPNVRHHTEMSYEEFVKHYTPVGPRGLLVLPPEKAPLVASLDFPEAALYDLVYEIASALDAYDRPRADQALARLAELAPNHRHYWSGRRALAIYDQNPVLHLEAIDRLRELYPEDDRLIHARAGLLRHLGRDDEARALLRERFARPNAPAALRNDYAEELRRQQRSANTVLRLAWRRLDRNPQNIQALTDFSVTLWNSQRKDESLAIQRLAVALGDKREHVAGTYFRMLLGLGRSEEGIDFLRRRAAKLLPRSGDPTLTLAESLHQLHRTQEARETLAAALQERPQDGDLMLYAAELEAVAVQPQRSAELLEAAASCTRRLVWLRAAARLRRREGNQEEALGHWQELAKTAPLDLEAHREIALLLARREGRAAGAAYLQEIGRGFPQHLGLLQLEIAWLHGEGDDELERRLVEFVTANPYDAWAQRELVLFWQRRQPGSIDDSLLQRAQFAREIDSSNPNSWLIEASVLRRMGREDEARKGVRRALELWIDNGSAQQQLLLLSESEDDKKEALAFIRAQLERQKGEGHGIAAYREVAFPVLPMEDLTSHVREFFQQRPEVWEASKALIAQLIAIGRLEEAQEVALAATRRFPLLAETWHQTGVILEYRDQRAAAIDYFRFVLQLEPEQVSAIHHLAEAYRHQNRAPEALALLEEAQRRNPLSSTLVGAYAENLWRLERRPEAIDAVRRAVEIDPDYQWGWNALSRWSRAALSHDQALELCRARAEKLQHDAGAWTQVARLAHGAGRGAEQLNAALRARECAPHDADVHDMVAVAYVRQHRYTEALDACWPPEFSGRNPLSLRGREAWIFSLQGRLDEAIAAMKDLVQINPQYAWGWDLLVDWHVRKENLPAALAACQRLVRLAPLVASGYLRRADIELRMKKSTEAKRDLQRALALSPLVAAGWQLLRLQLDGREYPAADETLRLMEPHVGASVRLAGRMLMAARRSQVDAALALFEEMALLPDVDFNAVNQAVAAVDSLGRADLLNARLGKVMKQADLNPFFAALWVARRGAHFKWKLMSHYSQVTRKTKARAAFLEEWLYRVGKTRLGLETARLIRKDCGELALAENRVWGNVGRVFTHAAQYREAAEWLANWRDRPDVEGWMVTNLVYAYHGLDRHAEADVVSREILERGLRDHTTSIHLTYLAITALEARQFAEARALFGDIEVESKKPERVYLRQMIEAALLVQEAASPEEKTSVYLAQKPRLAEKKPAKALGGFAAAQERRLLAVLAREAGKAAPPPPPPIKKNQAPPVLPPAPGEKDAVVTKPARSSGGGSTRGARRSWRLPVSPLRLVIVGVAVLGGIGRMMNGSSTGFSSSPPAIPAAPPGSIPVGQPVPVPSIPSPAPTPSTASWQPPHLNGPALSPPAPADDTAGLSATALAQRATADIDRGAPLSQVGKEMNEALHRAPNDPDVLCRAAEMCLRYRLLEQSLHLAQKAVSGAPDNARALGDMAEEMAALGHPGDATAAADRALAIEPKNAAALAAKGIVAASHKDWDQATGFLQQSIDSDPKPSAPWQYLAQVYAHQQRLPDGEVKLRTLSQAHADSESGWCALGAVLGLENKQDAALDVLEHGKAIDPNDYQLWNDIGLAHAHKNESDPAMEAFRRCLKLNGLYDEAWNNLGYANLQLGQTTEAIRYFQTALKINPRHTRALVNLTNAYIKTGQLDLARKTCDTLAAINAKLADSLRPNIH